MQLKGHRILEHGVFNGAVVERDGPGQGLMSSRPISEISPNNLPLPVPAPTIRVEDDNTPNDNPFEEQTRTQEMEEAFAYLLCSIDQNTHQLLADIFSKAEVSSSIELALEADAGISRGAEATMEKVTGRSDRIRAIIESLEVMVKDRVLRVPVSIRITLDLKSPTLNLILLLAAIPSKATNSKRNNTLCHRLEDAANS